MRKYAAITLLSLALFAATGWAMSTQGPTGLVTAVSADVLPSNTIEVSFFAVEGATQAGLNVGLIPNLEIGAAYTGTNGNSGFSGHAKYRVMKETKNAPALALGIVDDDYYMVASKMLDGLDVRGHIGIGKERGVFAGASKVLNPVTVSNSSSRFVMPTLTVTGEYADSSFNFGLDMEFDPDIRLKLTVHDLTSFGVGVGFRVGF